MDEALAQVVVDVSGRPYAVFGGEFRAPMLGQMPSSLVEHVFESIAMNAKLSLHARVLYGRDDHHKAEAVQGAGARARHHPSRRAAGRRASTKAPDRVRIVIHR